MEGGRGERGSLCFRRYKNATRELLPLRIIEIAQLASATPIACARMPLLYLARSNLKSTGKRHRNGFGSMLASVLLVSTLTI